LENCHYQCGSKKFYLLEDINALPNHTANKQFASAKQSVDIGADRGAQGANVLAYLVILYFERWYPTQNTVARQFKKLWFPKTFDPKKFWAGETTVCRF